MSADSGLTVSILIRLGDGDATEVAQATIPLRASVVKDDAFGTAYVELDWALLNDRLASALHKVADRLPTFGDRGVSMAVSA